MEDMDDMGSRWTLGSLNGALSVTQPDAVLLKVGRLITVSATGCTGFEMPRSTSRGLTATLGALPNPPNGIATLELDMNKY